MLDSMDLEREKGHHDQGARRAHELHGARRRDYQLNLIDTPGHVDFSYEVSRSLAACEGALLVVDAAQGIEAQTMANVYLALEQDLAIVAVINKIDLPKRRPGASVAHEVGQVHRACSTMRSSRPPPRPASASTRFSKRSSSTCRRRAATSGRPARALIFDSHYDSVQRRHRLRQGGRRRDRDPATRIRLMATGKEAEILEVGYFDPDLDPVDALGTGEVGYIATGLKVVKDVQVGDTITLAVSPATDAAAGYRPAKPMVFAGLYPVDSEEYPLLRDALERLQLNDASLTYEPESSDRARDSASAAGSSACSTWRSSRSGSSASTDLELLATAPSVEYEVLLRGGETHADRQPVAICPRPARSKRSANRGWTSSIIAPSRYIGAIMELVTGRRGIYRGDGLSR